MQCKHMVNIALTDLSYCCLDKEGHEGEHRIGISNDFMLIDSKNDISPTKLFGTCGCAEEFRKTKNA